MCEQFVARADEPFRIDALWELTDRLERYGIAGFSWGATWLASDGSLRSHRDVRAFRDDPGRADVGAEETTSLLVHLRRPSRLSTLGPLDTQPFDDPAGRYSFGHNGDFARHQEWRAGYREAGRIHGRADTEVGARWLEDRWTADAEAPRLLETLHETFEGQANLAVVTRAGAVHHYAGNRENRVSTFRLGPIRLACTGVHSLDRSLFRLVAPAASERALVPLGATASL